MSALIRSGSDILDGYVAWRVRADLCDRALADDLDGLDRARWLCEAFRTDFEHAFEGSRVYGTLGNFEGVVADAMPTYWAAVGQCTGSTVWKPNGNNPVGRWFAEAADRILGIRLPDMLDTVLKRHGMVGASGPEPQAKRLEDGWAVIQFRTKAFPAKPGVTRDPALLDMWRGTAKACPTVLADTFPG